MWVNLSNGSKDSLAEGRRLKTHKTNKKGIVKDYELFVVVRVSF